MTGNDSNLKVRFAPSPTGYLHIGGARTALFNYLYARKNNGTFLLRIEDTDVKREVEKSYEKILEDLRWLGIHWDEGPIRQSDRFEKYKDYAIQLQAKNLAYPCYCTPEELARKREKMMKEGKTPKYDGACRNLTPKQRREKEAQGLTACLRFKVPDKPVAVKDLIRGEVSFEKNFAGDFVILKSDGTPSYNFAVVIDDHEMGVTLVMRGEEHLVNTPRQILLYEALGFAVPRFAHISMILAPDRSKMSKRHGTVAVGKYRDEGFLPEALVNYIALLGWSPPGDDEFFTLKEMEEIFSLDRVSKSPAVYDVEKLKWMNAKYIQDMENEELLKRLKPYLIEEPWIISDEFETDREKLLKITEAVKSRITLLPDARQEFRIFLDDEIQIEKEAEEVLSWDTTPAVIDAFIQVLQEMGDIDESNFKKAVKEIQKKSGVRGKKLYMALRMGITGQAHGIDMHHLLIILSTEQMLKRLRQVKKWKIEDGG